MCGRYMLDTDFESLLLRYNIDLVNNFNFEKKEIFPSQLSTIITSNSNDKNTIKQIKWGFKSFYGNNLIINGRSETISDKKLFRNSFLKRRCIIPATSFFEWEQIQGKKIKRKISIDKFKQSGYIFN